MNTTTYKRINITLPEKTVSLLDSVADKGMRSRVIDTAVREYLRGAKRMTLRKQLAEGYAASAEDDIALAQEWYPLEHEVWQNKSA